MILMSGVELSKQIRLQLAKEVAVFDVAPKLAVIQVGDNPASTEYISMKEKAGKECGIDFELVHFDEQTGQPVIGEKIISLNNDDSVTGIIVQLPLPAGFAAEKLLEIVAPNKDVDGLTSMNQSNLENGKSGLFPATAEGVIRLLKNYDAKLSDSQAVVIGRSKLVGKPVAIMLEHEGANVTVCHSKTEDIARATREADIIVTAVGKTNLLTADMIKPGAVIVDVGMDVDFDKVSEVAGMITPPRGGVGPMTVAMLLSNVVKAAKGRNG